MFQRPKAQETEEDLLQQQEQFLKVSRNIKVPDKSNDFGAQNEEEKPKSLFEDVVFDIKENKSHLIDSNFEFKEKQNNGFPRAFAIDSESFTKKEKGGKSLFAMAMEKKRKKNVNVGEEVKKQEKINLISKEMNMPLKNDISCSDSGGFNEINNLKRSIHEENLDKLSQMSPNEILSQQKNLLKALDPNVIKFLKGRNKETKILRNEKETDISPCDSNSDELKVKLLNYLDDKWINLDFIEKEKLEWIGDIPDKKALEPNQPYSARFDFKGELLPYKMEIDVRTSLYHHGEEPERPGYTIQELFQLSRSQVLQQRIFSLNSLAYIIRKTKLGYYDNCFDGALLSKLLDSDLFFLLRFSIDENALISASVFCLHSLICNECDEFCLDKLLGVTNFDPQPFLYRNIEINNEEEGELKDHVIVSCDLIKGLLRTDFLARLSYVLNKCFQNQETVIKIINCLVRISRHSPEAGLKILDTPNLLEKIYAYITSKKPFYVGVKLLRIMCGQSQEIAKAITEKFDITFLNSFLEKEECPELTKKDFFMLKLETLYLWRNLLMYNLLVNEYLSWSCCLIRLLLFYVEKVDVNEVSEFDFELFSGITSLLIVCNKKKIMPNPYVTLAMRNCLEKWLTQLIQKRNEYNFSISKAVGSILRYFVTVYKTFEMTVVDLEFVKIMNSKLAAFMKSEIFEKMGRALVDFSYILSPSIPLNRDSENLPSLSTVYQGGNDFLRIVQHSSALPFFMSLIKYLKTVLKIYSESEVVVKLFLDSAPLRNYIKLFLKSDIRIHRWFLKYETNFLVGILQMLAIEKDERVLPLSFRLLPALRKDDSKAVEVLRVIFNSANWPNSANFPDPEASIYVRSMLQTVHKLHQNHTADLISEAWPYKVLADLKDKPEDEDQYIDALKFLCFVLVHRPKLFDKINHAARYYYTCYVFLKDSLLFNERVQEALEIIFKDIIVNKEKVKLEVKFSERKSFYDLFTEVITQYAGVSYGLSIFARFILFPLQNNQDVAFRKLLWFEYLHVLRVITLPFPLDDFISLKSFIEPCETDESLLVAYINSISNGAITKIRNRFIYNVAVGNIKHFLTSDSENQKLVSFMRSRIDKLSDSELKNDILSFSLTD